MLKKYLKLCKENNKYLYIFFLGLIVLGVLDILIPINIGHIIDSLTLKNLDKTIFNIALLSIIYLVLNIFELLVRKVYTLFFKNNFIMLHKKVINKIYSLTFDSLSKLSKGRIINTVNIDIINISEIPDYFFDILYNTLVIVVMILIFISTNIFLGIIIMFICALYLYFGKKITKKSNYYFKGQRSYVDKLINLLGETLNGLKEIKTSHIEHALNKKYDYRRQAWANKYTLKRKYVIMYQVHLKYLSYIFKIFLYSFLTYLLFSNKISIGIIIILVSYYDKIFDCASEIINDIDNLRDYLVSLDRIYDLLDYNLSETVEYGKIGNDNILGIVELKNVSFKYRNTPTIHNISFKALPNSITVIAGKTGSGKTTIFNLLLKLYNPDKGNIYIDGVNINNYSKDIYKSNISVVNQESFMFNMSIKDNLSLIDSNINNQIEVCKRVGIHNFIMQLPNGYNTILKENASNISGGQKRLLALAKTLLSKSEILLFDEVTSSLDPKNTDIIIKLLQDLKKDHTLIVITHKIEVMKKSDNIILLNRGRVVGNGTHHELIKNNNKYYIDLHKNNH